LGDFAKALADHQMVVLFYAIEAEILTGLESPDRAAFFTETARAYRARGKCLETLGRSSQAAIDSIRADSLEAKAKKLARKDAPVTEKTAPTIKTASNIQVVNAFNEPVTLVIAGVPHRLEIGEQRTIPAPPGAVSYEMQAGQYRAAGTLQAGKTYTIQPTP
jgi:hypothetical protein